VKRLEGFVENAENSQSDPNALIVKLESLLDRLEKVQFNQNQVVNKAEWVVVNAPPASAGPSSGFVKLFKDKCFGKVQALLDCTKNDIKNEHLVEGVNLYLDMLKS